MKKYYPNNSRRPGIPTNFKKRQAASLPNPPGRPEGFLFQIEVEGDGMGDLPEIRFCDPAVVNSLFALRRRGEITWRDMGVALAICNFIDRKVGSGWVARSIISAISGVNDRHVTRVFRKLEAKGFISKTHQSGRPTKFTIVQDKTDRTPLAEMTTPGQNSQGLKRHRTPGRNSQEPLAELAGKQVINKKQVTNAAVVKDAEGFNVPEGLLAAWEAAFPAVDVRFEIRKAFAWTIANPSKSSKKNHARFLNGWLGRAKPSKPTGTNDPLAYLDHFAGEVLERHGEAWARCFRDKARELGDVKAARAWLKSEVGKTHAE